MMISRSKRPGRRSASSIASGRFVAAINPHVTVVPHVARLAAGNARGLLEGYELVIDGNVGGNASKWINHSCAPNVEADDESGQVYLLALRNIKPGDELFFDYGLVIEERYTPALKKRFECRCGAKTCRGTMLAPKRGSAPKAPQRASGASKA